MNNIRVLLCDDHTLFRNGIVSLLNDQPGIYVVGEAVDGLDLIKKFEELAPDVMVVDISMPEMNGTEAVRELKKKYPGVRVLFLTMLLGEEYIYHCLKVGGLGLLNKTVAKGELVLAINEVYRGRKYFGPMYDDEKIKSIIKKYENLPVSNDLKILEILTDTEEKVLLLISEGLTSVEIAECLTIGKKTVDTHRAKLMKKLDLSSSASLIRFAVKYADSKMK